MTETGLDAVLARLDAIERDLAALREHGGYSLLLGRREISKFCRVSPSTLARWITSGFPVVRRGPHIASCPAWIMQHLANRETERLAGIARRRLAREAMKQ